VVIRTTGGWQLFFLIVVILRLSVSYRQFGSRRVSCHAVAVVKPLDGFRRKFLDKYFQKPTHEGLSKMSSQTIHRSSRDDPTRLRITRVSSACVKNTCRSELSSFVRRSDQVFKAEFFPRFNHIAIVSTSQSRMHSVVGAASRRPESRRRDSRVQREVANAVVTFRVIGRAMVSRVDQRRGRRSDVKHVGVK